MKIFGTAASKAFRALWMAEEAHIDYVHIPVHPKESKNHPDLLHINPRGTIPALQDGDFYLTESLALTTYIARQYAPEFVPSTCQGEANLLQWTLFAATEIEPPLIRYLHAKGIPFGEIDAERAALELKKILADFAHLESSLTAPFLLGKTFSVADLNVASVLVWAKIGHLELSSFPKMSAWLESCFQRPAYQKLRTQLAQNRRSPPH